MSDTTNPKDAIGRAKPSMAPVPANVLLLLAGVMRHGAEKYGRHNWREAGISASVYYDAALRHLFSWWEGEETDPESGLPHLAHAMATLCIALDAIDQGKMNDDRPKKSRVHPVTRETTPVLIDVSARQRMEKELEILSGQPPMQYPSAPARADSGLLVRIKPRSHAPATLAYADYVAMALQRQRGTPNKVNVLFHLKGLGDAPIPWPAVERLVTAWFGGEPFTRTPQAQVDIDDLQLIAEVVSE